MNEEYKPHPQFLQYLQQQKIIEIAQQLLMTKTCESLHNNLDYISQHYFNIQSKIFNKIKEITLVFPESMMIHHHYLNYQVLRLIRAVILFQNNIDARYFQSQSCFIIMAVTQGYLMQEPNPQRLNKIKGYFSKYLKKQAKYWGLDQLQNLYSFMIDQKSQYYRTYSSIYHQIELDRMSFFLQFYEKYPDLFSFYDVGSIIFKMMLCIREENQRDKLIYKKLKNTYLQSKHHLQTTTKNLKFALQFYKHPYKQKQCIYYPQKMIHNLLQMYQVNQIQLMISRTSIGVKWQHIEVKEYFINCIKLGFNETSVKMMMAMIKFCEKNGKLSQLEYNYQANLKKIFVFMKFPLFYNNCLTILKYFILSFHSSSLLQIFVTSIPSIFSKISTINIYPLVNLMQVLSFIYKQNALVAQINKIIDPFLIEPINKLSELQIKKIIEQYSWQHKKLKRQLLTGGAYNPIINMPKSLYKGLVNIGNSCYMNSFIQSLYMNRQFLRSIIRASTMEIRNQKLKNPKTKQKPQNEIQKQIELSIKPLAELQKLFALLMKANRNDINPSSLKSIVPEMFRNNYQHDTIEFGREFLELIFNNNIANIFEGQSTTQIFCKKCSKFRQRRQNFLDYHISVENTDIQTLLQKSFQQQILKDLTCDYCLEKGQESIKRHFISKFPNYLIMSINRFEYDLTQKRNKKNKAKIQLNPIIKFQNVEYQMYSLIVHTGPSPNAGHYFSFSRMNYDQMSKWVCHDDTRVTEMQSFKEVNSFLENSEEDTPYILFFERRSYIEQMKQDLSKPIALRDPQQNYVKKQNELYINGQKKVPLKLNTFNFSQFIKKDDDENPSSGGGFYNSYVS